MRYSKLALLSTLSAFALLTATASPAFAPSVTDMGLLKPHNIWQVGSVSAKNSNYCAMVSQFDKEITLAFARSPAGSGSLAIDFPGNILETGMTYPITMQVDDQEARRYNVRAASSRSLIVQIGQDEDFYTSLGSNGTLHVGLPTVDIRFDLSKFSSSYISLVTCAERLPKHEGPRTAAMPVTPVEQSTLPLKAKPAAVKIAAAQTTVAMPVPAAPVALIVHKTPDQLQMEEEAARDSLNHKGFDMQGAAPAVVAQKATPVSTAAAVSAPTAGITWTASAAKQLPDSLVHADKTSPGKLKDENENVVAENMELKSKLSQLELNQTELNNNVNLLKSEKFDLQSRLEMKEKQSQMLEAALNSKDRDLSSVRSLSNNDSKTLAETQAELASLKRDRDVSVAELQTKLSEKTAQYDTLQKQFTDGAEVRRTAQEKSIEALTEVETLRQRLAQAQEQIASSDSQKSDLATQVEFQGQQNRTLLQRVQTQLSKATQQIAMLESQLTSVAMQRDDLTSQLDAAVNKNKALEADLDVKQRELSYRPTAPASVTAGAAASQRDSMNLLGGETGYASAPAAAVAQKSSGTRGASSGPAGENWDTVVVQ